MAVIVRQLLLAVKYSCISVSIVDRWLLLLGGCCRQVRTILSLLVWQTGGCYYKVVAVDR